MLAYTHTLIGGATMHRNGLGTAVALALAISVTPVGAQEQEEQDQDADQDPAFLVCATWDDEAGEFTLFNPRGDDAAPECLTVTGTRLDHDPSTRVLVMTADDINARGLSTAEEIVRAIPHHFATVNSFNNTSPLATAIDERYGALGLGITTANLRGLGSRNTLVLVNGRRVAGIAGAPDFVANLRHIPAAAIERVEVQLDGGGAVYGSDAVGGVLNIVLKDDYVGFGLAGRFEHSATGGDQNRLVANYGRSWAGGNITLTASRTEKDPVNNHKTGYTTHDYRPRFGDDPQWNFVGESHPRSGLVSQSQWGPWLILPPGNDGRNAQPEDFRPTTPADFLDYVPRDASGASTDTAFTLNVSHTFDSLFGAGDLTVRSEAQWDESDIVSQQTRILLDTMLLPDSNAFNNFGRSVFVRYDTGTEAANGLIPPGKTMSVREHKRYLVGFEYEWSDTKRVVVDHTFAVGDGFGRSFNFAPRSVVATELANESLRDLLASSDPATAPNFLGDGSAQNPSIANFYLPLTQDTDRSYVRTTNAYWRGDIFDAPGGPMLLAIGGETRSEWLQDLDFNLEVETGIGVVKPTRDLTAAYVEVRLPLFGATNAKPGLQSLVLSAKGRWDSYETEGAVGSKPVDPNDPTGDQAPNLMKIKFSNVAPYVGIAWRPTEDLLVRASRAEGFVVPRFRDMFQRHRVDSPRFFVWDPLTGRFTFARKLAGSNPDLRPELSTTLSLGADWTVPFTPDMRLSLNYSDVQIRDRIANQLAFFQLLPREVYGNLPQFFVRDEQGNLLAEISTSVNISERVSKAMDFSLSKSFGGDYGQVLVQLQYYRVLKHYDRAFSDSEAFNSIGRSQGVDRYKTSLNVEWIRNDTSVNAHIAHTPSYLNIDHERGERSGIPTMRVASWTTLDLSARHRFDNGIAVRVGGRDLLGRDFPFMLTRYGQPWDTTRVDLRGRVLFLDVSYEFYGADR